MIIQHRQVEDFKTERPDVAPPLPPILRLVPLLFYVGVAGGLIISTHFYLQLRSAQEALETATQQDSASKAELVNVQTERASVEKQMRRANEVVAWVEGSHQLQPLVVSIIQSVEAPSTLASLSLERHPDTPTQVKLSFGLNTLSPRQLDATLGKIAEMDFRIYSPSQVQSRGQIEYGGTLIHQPRSGAQITPDPLDANEP